MRQVRSGQVWGHTPEQRVAASTLRREYVNISSKRKIRSGANPASPYETKLEESNQIKDGQLIRVTQDIAVAMACAFSTD